MRTARDKGRLADARGIATLKRAEVQKAEATAARDWTVRDLGKDDRAKKLVSLAQSRQELCPP